MSHILPKIKARNTNDIIETTDVGGRVGEGESVKVVGVVLAREVDGYCGRAIRETEETPAR